MIGIHPDKNSETSLCLLYNRLVQMFFQVADVMGVCFNSLPKKYIIVQKQKLKIMYKMNDIMSISYLSTVFFLNMWSINVSLCCVCLLAVYYNWEPLYHLVCRT